MSAAVSVTAAQHRAALTSRLKVARAITIVSWVLYVIGSLLLATSVYFIIVNDHAVRESAAHAQAQTQQWPSPDRKKMFDEAVQYNNSLPSRFGGAIPADMRNDENQPLESLDSTYLSTGGTVMATISIPSISVTVPVYHTTLDDALDRGAGHVYGTALPVGQNGTLSAIAAHSGGVQGLLFSRLSELKNGGFIYVNVFGSTQAYQVVNIVTVKPEQAASVFEAQRKVASADTRSDIPAPNKAGSVRISLMTCTPIGVNTRRLIVTAQRVSTPHPAPPISQVRDVKLIALIAMIIVLILAVILAVIIHVVKRRRRAQAAQAAQHAQHAQRAQQPQHAQRAENVEKKEVHHA